MSSLRLQSWQISLCGGHTDPQQGSFTPGEGRDSYHANRLFVMGGTGWG